MLIVLEAVVEEPLSIFVFPTVALVLEVLFTFENIVPTAPPPNWKPLAFVFPLVSSVATILTLLVLLVRLEPAIPTEVLLFIKT